jgi:ppGpp synthetase/RelA/SpoT-type nucleotidyltranferase
MDLPEIKKYYDENYVKYSRLADNIKEAFKTFLSENDLNYHTISSRIKAYNSYVDKIDRKNYKNPQDEIEDFCGVRIVCFYPQDLDKIQEIIDKEFDVLDSIDKSEANEIDRFGYRSKHYIVKIKKEWATAPNYRYLENLKVEIQVRTILMHVWADIEHKLAYKKKEDIPDKFKRKLYQLSALLEIADNQFQDLKNQKESFQKSLVIDKKGIKEFDFTQDLNLDSLQAYLDFAFPDEPKSENSTRILLQELINYNISLYSFNEYVLALGKFLPKIETEVLGSKNKLRNLTQVGKSRMVLDLMFDEYWNDRKVKALSASWFAAITKWREKVNKK